ncbi:hypothetical protein F4809DRAFT_599243 [Biscogniauxia mediterranea]|nr:hypothetical protein F4809DRAFT_599243 [Biscogniauxia mediterranea]
MAFATAVGSPLDRLPDEILQHILYFAMKSRSPFFLEYYNEASIYLKNYSYSYDEVEPMTLELECWSVYNQHPSVTVSRKARQCPTQVEHKADWISINSTNRRIRRVGKGEFFKAKVLAMTHALPEKLQTGAVHDLVSPEDRALALKYARDVVLVHNNPCKPTEFIGLAKRLKPFPRLEGCTLLFGYQLRMRPKRVVQAVAGTPETGGRFRMPDDFRQLLVGSGVPERMDLWVATHGPTTWSAHMDNLVRYVYPILRFRAEALARKRMAENKERESSGTA